MKKAFFSLLLLSAMAGTTFAAKHSLSPITKKNTIVASITSPALKRYNKIQELPHVYTFITSCGPWILTTADGVLELDFFGRIGIWASFEAACVSM